MHAHSSPSRWVTAGVVAVLAAVLVLSRTLLAPTFLYFFDSVNFALALDDFNPALHQPQPPGYPLFVLLAKGVFAIAGNPQKALVWTGILGSAAALVVVWRVGREMFGARVGFFAALILLLNPPFWFGGLTNQVRVFLAVAGAVTLFAAWRSLNEESPRWFYAGAAMLGALSAFRPDSLFFAAPLLVYAGWRSRRSPAQWGVAAALASLTTGAWVVAVANEVGGAAALVDLIRSYSDDQFRHSSLVFGAKSDSAMRMFQKAVIWYGLPVLTWLILVPFSRGASGTLRPVAGLLAISVIPAFLFHSVIHVGDPDHTVFAVPALCLIGAVVVSRVRWASVAVAGVVALNVLVFFKPPKGIAQACSYGSVRQSDIQTRETLRAIEELRSGGPMTLVVYDHHVSWRHLFYYYPDVPLLVLNQDPRTKPDPRSAWFLHRRQMQQPVVEKGEIRLPAGRNVWLLSHGRGMHSLLSESISVNQPSAFLAYTDLDPGMHFRFGDYRFSTGRETEEVRTVNAGTLSKRLERQP